MRSSSTSSGCRHPGRGSSDGPTATPWPSNGWASRRSTSRPRFVHLVRRYLAGFGPASRADVASWTGLQASALKPALAALDLRRFRDAEGRELIDLPDAPLPDDHVTAPVRFLPTWDANLLVHARRTGFLPEPYRARIFSTKTPHSFPTFLVDGAVAGTWRYEDGRVVLDPFDELPTRRRRAVDEEADRLAAWHAEDGA